MKARAIVDGNYINLIDIDTQETISRVRGKIGCVRIHLTSKNKEGTVQIELRNYCHKSYCCHGFVFNSDF